jgi:saccharopine dehydrogenase (NAD+, L-glutamate forming)
MAGRAYDLVLFGATGFTGGLTADYLAAHAPADLRWAIAGRNPRRLAEISARLAGLGAAGASVDTVPADSTDPRSLRALTESTRQVATTVGPFLQYGAPLVAAAAEAGTDYLDVTGEPEFVDRMWLEHHDTAVSTGARLVHCCGFDSIPSDLGVLWSVQQTPPGVPLTVRGFVRADASFSGGTYASAIGAVGRARHGESAAAERRRLEPRGERRVRSLPPRPQRVPGSRRWSVPLPTIDPIVVRRSARALDRYGPDFTYGHAADVGSPAVAVAATAGMAAVAAAAQLPPARGLLLRLKPSGQGPDAARRARSWFRVRFHTTWPVGPQEGQLVTEVAGGDPGYDETAKMLAESALCLLRDAVPPAAGQVTTAQAMGQALVNRLTAAGMTFTVLDGPAVR